MIRLSEEALQALRAHGAASYPLECVGALLGHLQGEERIVQEARPLANSFDPSWEREAAEAGAAAEAAAPGQERRYMVSPDAMFLLMREERKTGRKVLGFYHTHPDHPALPSVFDRDWASPWYAYFILSVRKGEARELTAWQLEEESGEFAPREWSAEVF